MNKTRHVSVGINDYPGNRLNGCVNDAHDWSSLLVEGGSTGIEITDAGATKRAIVSALTETLLLTGFGDTFIFTYSGHGTWLPDQDGDEADGRDEALVPFDYASAGMLLDDDLYKIVATNKRFGAKILFITDSCYSGTVERAFGSPYDIADRTARFLPPIQHLDPASLAVAERVQHSRAVSVPRTGAALFSGCDENEVSWDVDFSGRANGAMTRAAIDAYRQSRPENLTQWRKDTQAVITSDQHPQVQGTAKQRLRTDFMPH